MVNCKTELVYSQYNHILQKNEFISRTNFFKPPWYIFMCVDIPVHIITRGTEVQTLGELHMRGTTN